MNEKFEIEGIICAVRQDCNKNGLSIDIEGASEGLSKFCSNIAAPPRLLSELIECPLGRKVKVSVELL